MPEKLLDYDWTSSCETAFYEKKKKSVSVWNVEKNVNLFDSKRILKIYKKYKKKINLT